MTRWRTALSNTDPLTGQTVRSIEFVPCAPNCQASYLLIRYNQLSVAPHDNIPAGVEIECNSPGQL